MNQNDINNQFQKLQRGMKFNPIIGKTPTNQKWIVIILLGILPMLIFNLFFVWDEAFTTYMNYTNYPMGAVYLSSLWQSWLISLGVWAGALIGVAILIKRNPTIYRYDLLISVSAWSWFVIGWMLMYTVGWWKIILAFVYYIAANFITYIVVFLYAMKQMVNKGKKMMNQVQNDPMFQQFSKSMGGFNMNDMKKQLDEQLKQQGIDIEDLNKKFGDALEEETKEEPTIEIEVEEDKKE